MSTTFERPNKLDTSKSAFDFNRSIWQEPSADADDTRRTIFGHEWKSPADHSPASTARQNSATTNNFGRSFNPTALSTLENPRNSTPSTSGWGSISGSQATSFTSPTKRSKHWLYDSKNVDVENSSSLLAGSAPEHELVGDNPTRDRRTSNRAYRLSDEGQSSDPRYAPSHRSTGPAQLPTPNRYPTSTTIVSNGMHGSNNGSKSSNSFSSFQENRGRNEYSGSLETSPTSVRGLAPGPLRTNSNTISPTTAKFARQMNGYLERTVGSGISDDAIDAFQHLSINSKSAPMYGNMDNLSYGQQRPIIVPDDEFLYDANYYHDNSNYLYEREYINQQPMNTSWQGSRDYATDYHSGVPNPYYSTTGTPSSGSDTVQRNSLHETGNGQRKHNLHDPYYSGYGADNVLNSAAGSMVGFNGRSYEMQMNPMAQSYHGMYGPYRGQLMSRDDPKASIPRSQLLEEFRANKTNKRYELRDIFGYIVEFSGDQHGSRFIQSKLETANSDEKDQVFKEIQGESMQLMTDVFGNYVIQKMFEHGNQSQKKVLADCMKTRVAYLSTQMYGCRVVQKALEHVLTDQQASMIKELDGPNKSVLKIIRDQNGNHVIQKAIERVPAEHIQFIIDAHKGDVVRLAQHTYGCRVIQRIMEYCTPAAKRVILDELHGCIGPLITDGFGNYVVQHVIQKGEPTDRRRVVSIVLEQLLVFSKHKFASNVVEKCLEYGDPDQREAILMKLMARDVSGMTPVLGLLKDQYGNYVIRKCQSSLEMINH
jgi:hypothetical protein